MYKNHSLSWILSWWFVYRWETRLPRKRMRAFKKYQKQENLKESKLLKINNNIIYKDNKNMKQIKYEDILYMLSNKNEFCTNPIRNSIPKWFCAKRVGDSIVICNSITHKYSTKISKSRKLDSSKFNAIYKLFLRRCNGESVAKEATQITRNQVYWYGLINECLSN